MNRLRLLAPTTVLVAALALAGCGGGSHPTAAPTTPAPSTTSAGPILVDGSSFRIPFTLDAPRDWMSRTFDEDLISLWKVKSPEDVSGDDAPINVSFIGDRASVPARREIALLHRHAGAGAGPVVKGAFAGTPAWSFRYDPGRAYVLDDGLQRCTPDTCFHGPASDHLLVRAVQVGRRDLLVVSVGPEQADQLEELLEEADQVTSKLRWQ